MDIAMADLGDKLYETAERYDRVDFLQKNSVQFLAATEGAPEDLDPCDMARNWHHYYVRWQHKAVKALDAQERMMAEFLEAEEARAA